MSAFDGPISRCEAMRTMVLTDQTQAQCSCEHGCPPGIRCPLAGCFADPPPPPVREFPPGGTARSFGPRPGFRKSAPTTPQREESAA